MIRAQIGGMSQAVCLFACSTSSAFGAVSEDVSGEALVSALPRGGVRRYDTRPFAPRLWGRLRRFACLGAQHPVVSEHFVRTSQARRWFQESQGGAARRCDTRPFAAGLWGCLKRFAYSRFAFTVRPFQFSPDEAKTVPRQDKHMQKIKQIPRRFVM